MGIQHIVSDNTHLSVNTLDVREADDSENSSSQKDL
jgi:hypothetical protein